MTKYEYFNKNKAKAEKLRDLYCNDRFLSRFYRNAIKGFETKLENLSLNDAEKEI